MRAAASLDVEGVRNSWTPGAIGSFADEGYLDYLKAIRLFDSNVPRLNWSIAWNQKGARRGDGSKPCWNMRLAKRNCN